ncbi:S-receptor-like serine/threonine-protein kinase [Trema orientale]|uniref:Receptor-like serine/threonine-protein kinase n=1 Tax=Trema orientale TaxID=63057 RepID=A0A2P5EJU7_TREOI|nr:S-receptor-like serine/threonine-protein kinase [Trema orientale]
MGANHRDYTVSVFSIFLLMFYGFPTKKCYAIYNINTSQALSKGQTLVSSGQIFELGFFTPNNSANQYVGMWYKQVLPHRIVWVANREYPLRLTDTAASLRISSNANLELVNGTENTVLWSTNIHVPSNSSVAVLSDDGNFLLKDALSGEILWQSFDHPGDTFLPGAVLGFNVKTGQNHMLTSWKISKIDPSLGSFVVGIAPQRPPEAFIWLNGSTPYWRSGPWDRSRFVGIPDMDTIYQSPFNLVEDESEGTTYLSFTSYNSSTLSNIFLSSNGFLAYVLKEQGKEWYANWIAPYTRCDLYGFCGPFGVCKATESPVCKCLKGFEPKSYEEWSKGNWTGGCVRRTELLCETNTSKRDGFQKMGSMKLPAFHEYVKFEYDDEARCPTWCLENCSCLAYAYVDGIGCLVWSQGLLDIQEFSYGGQDLFLRLAHKELVGGKHTKKIIVSLAVAFSVAIISAIVRLRRKKAKQNAKIKETTENFDLIQTSNSSVDTLRLSVQHDPSELPIFDFGDILVATDNFNITNKLGQGGFGSVYKGKLHDGREIAVKRLSSSSGQGIEEFKNEISLISKLQHRNLVKLFGCCIEKEERLLIYEFLPNKSLDFFVFDPTRRARLTWATRFNIIHGVARGLLYLHRDSCLRIIHRDMKVSNILLDEKMNPKISDFGLARIFQGTLDLANTHRVVGTLGYMSPEYAMGGVFSEKSDVFSFGVLLLEIVSGRKNANFHYYDQHLSLISLAWQLWSESRALDLVDELLTKSYPSVEVMRCIHVGLLCVQDHAADRPSMPDVVLMLSKETDRPQPKQPIFAFQSSPRREIQPQAGSTYSVNDDTISLFEGR